MKALTYADRVIHKVTKKGIYVYGTRELTGFTDRILVSDSFWLKRSGADVEAIKKLFQRAIIEGDTSFNIGPYCSKYYTFLGDAITEASKMFTSDGPYTRRAVVTFPSSHCFSSIQVLVRPTPDGHIATIIVNMRSCNVESNFIDDMLLSHMLGKLMLDRGFGYGHGVKIKDLAINIGSLHRFIHKK